MRAAENDFEGYSDDNSTGKGRDGAGRRRGRFCEGAGCMQDVARLLFVRVHIGRGQDPCISEQVRCTRRTPTARGLDGVKMVGRQEGRRGGVTAGALKRALDWALFQATAGGGGLCGTLLGPPSLQAIHRARAVR